MNRRDLPVRIVAAACAVGLTICGLFLRQEKPPTGGEESEIPPVMEDDNCEAEIPDREWTLKIICPKLSTAADAFLLTTGEHAVLIDTGEEISADTILTVLEENGVKKLDALILTHFDKDHIGGAAAIVRQVKVDILYRTTFVANSPQYTALMDALSENSDIQVEKLYKTVSFTLDGVTYTLYPPMKKSYDKNQQNNSSIITSVTTAEGGHSLLFMGDAEKARVKEYLNHQYDGTSYEFLKVPHHGRDLKPMEKLLQCFVPKAVLVTSSRDEPENSKLMKALIKENVDTYLTREGRVTILCDEIGFHISQEQS